MAQRLTARPPRAINTFAGTSIASGVAWATDARRSTNPVVLWNEANTRLLIISGDDFVGATGNASSLLSQFETIGVRCLSDLQGWFSGVLVDLRNSSVTIFTDRYGLGRIYYHDASTSGLFFATEAKPLLYALPVTRQFDLRGLGEFIALGCVLQNRTLFKDVHILPAGAAWIFHNDGRVDRKNYFDPTQWEQQTELEPREYSRCLAEVFGHATRRVNLPSQRAGLSLTGGLDSRAVLAWACAAPGTLPCYTFGGPYRDCADVKIARKLAAACSQPHTTLRVGHDFFDRFESLAERAVTESDGTMDVSGSVELYVNELAAAIAPVRLTGNYGSEIIRHNVALRPRNIDRTLYAPDFLPYLDQALATYERERQAHPLSFIAFKQLPWYHHGRFSIERSALTPRTPFLDHELVRLAYRAPPSLRKCPQTMIELIAAGNPGLATIRSDRAHCAGGSAVVNTVANLWQELTARAEYIFDYGMPHALGHIDFALSTFHPERLILGHHKFYHFRTWYRDDLSDLLRAEEQAAKYVPAYLAGVEKQIIDAHLQGRRNNTQEIHHILTLRIVEHLLLGRS